MCLYPIFCVLGKQIGWDLMERTGELERCTNTIANFRDFYEKVMQ